MFLLPQPLPLMSAQMLRSEVSVSLSSLLISLWSTVSAEIHSSILKLGGWDPEPKGFGCFLEVHRVAIVCCILLLISLLANNENHLPVGKLFVPEQIIITLTSSICTVQGHCLCFLPRHFPLRLSDCLGQAGSCGKEGRKDGSGCQRRERSRLTPRLVSLPTHLSFAWSKLQVKSISFLVPSSWDPWGGKTPVLLIFLPISQCYLMLVKASACTFLTKIGGDHDCPQQTGACHASSSLLQGDRDLLFPSEPQLLAVLSDIAASELKQVCLEGLGLRNCCQPCKQCPLRVAEIITEAIPKIRSTNRKRFSQEICSVKKNKMFIWFSDSYLHSMKIYKIEPIPPFMAAFKNPTFFSYLLQRNILTMLEHIDFSP